MLHALTLAGVLAAAPAASAGDKLDVRITDVRDVDASLKKTRFTVMARATRPKGPRIRLRGLDYTVRVGDQVLTSATTEFKGVVLKKGIGQDLPVRVELNTMATAGALLGSLGGGQVDVKLEGTARIRVLLIPIEVPFSATLVDVDLKN